MSDDLELPPLEDLPLTLPGDAGNLIDRGGREKLKKRIIAAIAKETDVHVEDVLFTDMAVQ